MADSRNELLLLARNAGPDSDWPRSPDIQTPAPELEPLVFELSSSEGGNHTRYSYSAALRFLTNMLTGFIKYLPELFGWLGGRLHYCYGCFFRRPSTDAAAAADGKANDFNASPKEVEARIFIK